MRAFNKSICAISVHLEGGLWQMALCWMGVHLNTFFIFSFPPSSHSFLWWLLGFFFLEAINAMTLLQDVMYFIFGFGDLLSLAPCSRLGSSNAIPGHGLQVDGIWLFSSFAQQSGFTQCRSAGQFWCCLQILALLWQDKPSARNLRVQSLANRCWWLLGASSILLQCLWFSELS